MALTLVQQIRLLIQDNTPGLYVISDEELEFLLTRHDNNITRASLEAAKIVLFNLSMRTDETTDIFSIKSSGSARLYMEALKLYIKDPQMNPVLQNTCGWVGGVSKSEMLANDATSDNNIVITGSMSPFDIPLSTTGTPRYF